MQTPILFFNPRCSTCRKGQAVLDNINQPYTIKAYLEEGCTKEELTHIFSTYKGNHLDLIRPKECKELLHMDPKEQSVEALIEYIIQEPRILQRPILVFENDIRLGRPPELLEKSS